MTLIVMMTRTMANSAPTKGRKHKKKKERKSSRSSRSKAKTSCKMVKPFGLKTGSRKGFKWIPGPVLPCRATT